jgi:8-oxo-dGTP pyrophosphatase MutT (NUDIX family)
MMGMAWPKIISRRTTRLSPWVEIIEREVEFKPGASAETYHAISQPDYVAVVARTPDGMIPIVRQFRPAVEGFTWELPAGMADEGETPAECCRRELLEETGLTARAVHILGSYSPCTARLSNRIHSFFVDAGPYDGSKVPDDGVEHKLVTPHELSALILAGEFALQLHIGALLLAGMRGHLDLAALR